MYFNKSKAPLTPLTESFSVHVLRIASWSFFPPCAGSTATMKLRSGRIIMATPPSLDDDGDSDDMNASLWGELQSFVDLSVIYAKLPLAPFFRLRQVCKEWNRLASDRQFLLQNFKPPIASLYFVVARRTGHRLWTCQDSSWTSSPLPPRRCEVSGLLYYEASDRDRVFDLHTRVFHSLPHLPLKFEENSYMLGMTVDTTVIPYGFRVFIANEGSTITYDSNSGAWTCNWSYYEFLGPKPSILSSVHYKNFLYVLVENYFWGGCFVHRYGLEDFVLDGDLFGLPESWEWEYGGIGVWRDRWFAFGKRPTSVVTAWQMNTHLEEPWTVFDCMPEDLCEWMMRGLRHKNVLSAFCGAHVLVYNRLEAEERAVLYNLDLKTWDKIEFVENTGIAVKRAHVPE